VRSRCCLALSVSDRAEAPLEVCGMVRFRQQADSYSGLEKRSARVRG